MKRTIIGVVAAAALLIGSAANAASISVGVVPTADGATVTLTLAGEGTVSSGFAVLLNHSVGTGNVDSITAGYGTGFDISQAGFCNATINQCQGANGAQVFSPAALIPDSVSVFTISGLAPGTQIDFTVTDAGSDITLPGPFSAVAIPEPTTAALLGLGLVGLATAGRRR